jgi:S1/P1 Nuclease
MSTGGYVSPLQKGYGERKRAFSCRILTRHAGCSEKFINVPIRRLRERFEARNCDSGTSSRGTPGGKNERVCPFYEWSLGTHLCFQSAANDLDVSHWIDESLKAAEQIVYKTPIGAGTGRFTLTQAYKTAARKFAEKRIALAGARLAKILNEELR